MEVGQKALRAMERSESAPALGQRRKDRLHPLGESPRVKEADLYARTPRMQPPALFSA